MERSDQKVFECALTTLTSRPDVGFIERTLRHLCEGCPTSVSGKVVFVDTTPLAPAYQNRPGVGSMDDLRMILNRLRGQGVIDDIVTIPYDAATRRATYKKHFDRDLRITHDFRGVPVYGWVYSTEMVDARYVLHFDSDMLVYQNPNHDWVVDAIGLLERRDDVMFVAPRSGPPMGDGQLQQRGVDYTHDQDGFFSFKKFTSRKYLFDRERFRELLPLTPVYTSWKRRVMQVATGKSALWNWEMMVSRALQESRFVRADLDAATSWTLHTPDHGTEFIEKLPEVIRRVEAGDFPAEQAGHYDLLLDLW